MEKVDELKSKFFDLIQGNAKIPVVGRLPGYDEYLQPTTTTTDSQNDVGSTIDVQLIDRPADSEILETVDEIYFSPDGDFDAARYELNKIRDLKRIDDIEEYLNRLKRQQLVVSNRVLQMILDKKFDCQKEFDKVVVVQKCLDDALYNVRLSRDQLELATRHFTTASLGILATYRRRTLVQQLLRYLKTIKSVYEKESRFPDMFKNGRFSSAIDLILECQRLSGKYRHFTCIDALSVKLQDTLVMAEEHLDGSLSIMCYEFDDKIYGNLQSAYALLSKTKSAVDQLNMHFTSVVQKKSSYVVQSYGIIEASSSNDEKEYVQMCKDVPEEHFIPCLITLCKTLWRVVLSYYQVVEWHGKNPQNSDDFQTNYDEEYVNAKLNHGLLKLWTDVQGKVSNLVLAGNLSNYKIDDFLEVLSILHRFAQVGEELGDTESKEVADSVRTQCSCYFDKFHADKLDDLKVIMDNEAWTPCPVRNDFTLLHLQEFLGLRSILVQCSDVKNFPASSGSSTGANFFARFPDPKGPTPFDVSFHPASNNEDIMNCRIDDDDDNLSESSYDGEETGAHHKRAPLITNTTLSVLRLCGKYLQMSRLLKSISVEVVYGLTQLFEFYLYVVYAFFTSDVPDSTICPVPPSLKLVSVVKRINETLFHDDKELEVPVNMVRLDSDESWYGLKESIVAVESLIFLSDEFIFLKPHLEKLIESQTSSFHCLQQFYSQSIAVVSDLRQLAYLCASWRVVNSKQILALMSKVDWEIEHVTSQHSKYVDLIFLELENFDEGIKQLSRSVYIPEQADATLWDRLIFLIAHIFVEGFAGTKKCSDGGRGQMQLDFIQYTSKLSKICPLQPIPYVELVDSYIKAYYETDEGFEKWIKSQKDYSAKQLVSLVSCKCSSNKKMRQKLTSLIESSKEDLR